MNKQHLYDANSVNFMIIWGIVKKQNEKAVLN